MTVLTGLPPKQYKIVGIAKFGTADSLAGASVALFTVPEAQRIAGDPGKFDYVDVVAKPGVSQEQVAAKLRTHPRGPQLGNLEVVTGKALTKENQSQIGKALGFLRHGPAHLRDWSRSIVGAFIIYNTFSIVVAQRMREMALLRAIGASTRQVLVSVIGESIVVGVIASAIGVVAGIGLAIGLKRADEGVRHRHPGTGAVVPAEQCRRSGWSSARRDAALGHRARAPGRARSAGRGACATSRSSGRSTGCVAVVIGLVLGAIGLASLLLGLFANAGIWWVILGAVLLFVGVFVLGPLFARFMSSGIGAPIATDQGRHRHPRPRERGP